MARGLSWVQVPWAYLIEEHFRAVLGHVEREENNQATKKLSVAGGGELLKPVERGICEDGKKLGELRSRHVAD